MPAIIYKNKAKKRVPSVTTILRVLGFNKDPLMFWAWNEGIEGRNYRDTSQKAASIGTLAHLAVEADVKDQPFDLDKLEVDDDAKEKIKRCIEAWRMWRDQSKLQIVGSEVSLVSEELQIGGTMDCVAVNKRTAILDLKTGSGVYAEMLLQVAAYGYLWNEHNPENKIEEYHLIRVGKEDASFHHHYWPDLSKAFEAFKHARELYELHKTIKKMV